MQLSDLKFYFYNLTTMYDGIKFTTPQRVVALHKDQDIQKYISSIIEEEIEDGDWDGQWFTDYCGKSICPGNHKEITYEQYLIVGDVINVWFWFTSEYNEATKFHHLQKDLYLAKNPYLVSVIDLSKYNHETIAAMIKHESVLNEFNTLKPNSIEWQQQAVEFIHEHNLNNHVNNKGKNQAG